MSTYNGPGSVTNGLVLDYDMGNQSKSFIGAPTTNLSDFPATGYNWINSGNASYTDNDTSESLPYVPNISFFTTPLRVVSCQTTTASTTGQQCGYAYTAVSGSTTYTMSLWYKKNRDDMASYGPYVRQSVNNNWLGTFDYNGQTNNALWPTGVWIRIKSTFTTSSNETAVYLSNYIGQYVGDKVCYCGGQLEQKSFATPLAQGSRTNTQSIIDLTQNNTITASSLTYNNDGTFSFNGSSDYMIFPENSNLNTQTPTVEVWVKTNATTQNGFWFEKGNVNTQYALFQEGANITWRHTTNVGSLTAPAASYMNTSQYAQVVGTYTAGDRRIYVNGVQVASDSLNYSLPTNANGASIGVYGGYNGSRGYYYNGNIAIVKVYNRTLTASEVLQNFNALRGRFGI